jgi:hypothetical protein
VRSKYRWMYGVTTVPKRFKTTLPDTLRSLEAGGFDRPWLFVDGCRERNLPSELANKYDHTCRYPRILAYGNWILSLGEMYIRSYATQATHFALFQDDFITYKNLRQYLEQSNMPVKGYCNLYTYRDNDNIIKNKPDGWYEASSLKEGVKYHGKMQQYGRGAVALVFTREMVQALLSHQHIVMKAYDGGKKRYSDIDGGVVETMNMCGYREYIHNPSLVQHMGEQSTIGNRGTRLASSFHPNCDDYDALDILK